ncbi:phenylacetic acid degradation B [Sulfobacillus acidophilus TPY]|uniref:Phenylacetic acid degradation B n=1 Tax=Sulfobacillus acidophilus (strain ATCC 700253 / DSM 10332 / NAL) TaxID=679936 RepID=G8TYU8_SULAD|nr:phenylacetic acid degradation B [Sulfobacillus acidophilus TPY]AEW05127.1 phenylacetic acid degradation B [Sulfobacillus acidophilus DSM 10332]
MSSEYPVYEVFGRREPLGFHTHVGSIRAASPELALQMAREAFFRRESAVDIWVVSQDAIFSAATEPAYLPEVGEDKKYRMPSGYDNAPHWKRFKARAMTIEEVAEEMTGKKG